MPEWMRDISRRLSLLERRRSFAGQVPVGAVVMFAGQVPPEGWLRCDGSAVPPGHGRLVEVLGSTVLPTAPGPGSWIVRG
jgi:hypothetical protein